MTAWRGTLILLALWGMNLSWLYGWLGTVMLAGFGEVFPQGGAILLSGCALLLTRFTRGRGWRNYLVVGVHLLSLSLAVFGVVYHFEQPGLPFYRAVWFLDFLAQPKAPGEWLLVAAVLSWSIVFWAAGIRLALRPRDHITASNHFDAGVIAFILLSLLELLLKKEGGIVLAELALPRVFLAFFFFSVLAFCLVRCQGQGRSDFLVGFRGIGVVLGFASVVLLVGSGLIALFLPVLSAAATSGVAALQTIAAPAGAFLVRLLSFFFGSARMRTEQAGAQAGQDAPLQAIDGWQPEGWLALLQQGMVFLAMGLLCLLMLALAVLLAWQLIWWLGQKTATASPGPSPWRIFFGMLGTLAASIANGIRKLVRRKAGPADPVQLYRTLTIWGGRSGLALLPSETPARYGRRLIHRFPPLKQDILTIIALHDEAIYGECPDVFGCREAARSASRRLHAPRLWLPRLKSLLYR